MVTFPKAERKLYLS